MDFNKHIEELEFALFDEIPDIEDLIFMRDNIILQVFEKVVNLYDL